LVATAKSLERSEKDGQISNLRPIPTTQLKFCENRSGEFVCMKMFILKKETTGVHISPL